ncbi:hypothetical protein TNCV_4734891 [Trichonephila clavipes]|nr:hypothetical protein TNCV_4734891 [Trichonephila clavipes]
MFNEESVFVLEQMTIGSGQPAYNLTSQQHVDDIQQSVALHFIEHLTLEPFTKKIMPTLIRLAYFWTASVLLLSYFGVQNHQIFRLTNIFEAQLAHTSRRKRCGIFKISQIWSDY